MYFQLVIILHDHPCIIKKKKAEHKKDSLEFVKRAKHVSMYLMFSLVLLIMNDDHHQTNKSFGVLIESDLVSIIFFFFFTTVLLCMCTHHDHINKLKHQHTVLRCLHCLVQYESHNLPPSIN